MQLFCIEGSFRDYFKPKFSRTRKWNNANESNDWNSSAKSLATLAFILLLSLSLGWYVLEVCGELRLGSIVIISFIKFSLTTSRVNWGVFVWKSRNNLKWYYQWQYCFPFSHRSLWFFTETIKHTHTHVRTGEVLVEERSGLDELSKSMSIRATLILTTLAVLPDCLSCTRSLPIRK